MRSFLLALFSISTIASATSIKNDRISIKRTTNDETQAYSSVVVDSAGDIRLVIGSKHQNFPVVKIVGHMNATEMNSINQLIALAKSGEYVTQSAKCFVAPAFITDFLAANGTVILSKGDICYTVKRNTSEAAKALLDLLSGLLEQYAPKN